MSPKCRARVDEIVRAQRKPTRAVKISIGRTVKDRRALHRLEASLRVSSRLEGRFLHSYYQMKSYNNSAQGYSHFFACVLGNRCSFYIRLTPKDPSSGGGWSCVDLCSTHSCFSIARPISDRLQEMLSFWVSPFSLRPKFFSH